MSWEGWPPHSGHPSRINCTVRDPGIDSAAATAISVATGAAEAATSGVGLITQQADVQEINTDAASAGAASTTDAAVATTTAAIATAMAAAATVAKQRQNGPRGEQLHMLTVDLDKTHCVKHKILLQGGPVGQEQNTSSIALSIRLTSHHGQKKVG